MKCVPQFALVWLAMAAAMLPAGARPVHAMPARQTNAPAQPLDSARPRSQGVAFPTKAPSVPVSPGHKIIIAAPALDVWDGHAVRMVGSRTALDRPILAPAFPQTRDPAFNPAPNGRSVDSVTSRSLVSLSERDWLACRDAHAPPNPA